MKTNYVYLENAGVVYRLTRRGFERWLKKTARQGYPPDIEDYGTMLCIIDHRITDWDIDDVKRHLPKWH
jgi:hypothetical protein